jgi:hypothetical protein
VSGEKEEEKEKEEVGVKKTEATYSLLEETINKLINTFVDIL